MFRTVVIIVISVISAYRKIVIPLYSVKSGILIRIQDTIIIGILCIEYMPARKGA